MFISDAEGDAVIHAGWLHHGHGLLPGNVRVVRRSYPDGRARWTHSADHQVTAVDALGGIVYVTLNSGELLALRATDGHAPARHCRHRHPGRAHPPLPHHRDRLTRRWGLWRGLENVGETGFEVEGGGG
ncbi:hypothetical protein [Acrocarpospora sp. B8E8]|uniref:hypothetical protein n=1 Tax=Acrocarpospora sp. B8E8 TaxID=3153572 RepID=UPI00325FAA10